MTSAENCFICGELDAVQENWLMYGRHPVCPKCQDLVEKAMQRLQGIRKR